MSDLKKIHDAFANLEKTFRAEVDEMYPTASEQERETLKNFITDLFARMWAKRNAASNRRSL